MRRWNRGFGGKRKFAFSAVCIVIVAAVIYLLIDAKIQPAVHRLAALEAKNTAVRKINVAAEKVIEESLEDCRNIISVSYNESKTVSGISADMVKLNLLKSRVTVAVDEAFKNEPETVVRVPIGSAAEIALLQNQGPYKDISVGYSACVSSDFDNIFQSTGINQTEYSILLRLSVEIIMLLPGSTVTETVSTSFCIAQAVIVGNVPKSAENVTNYVTGK